MSTQRGRGKDFRHGAKDPTRPRSYKEDKRMLEPKKGGGGGKGTWGKPGDEINPTNYYIDERDPNFPVEDGDTYFESYEPELSLEEIQKEVGASVEEYFEHGDSDEVFDSLKRFKFGSHTPELIPILVNLGLERRDEERELVSVLIAEGIDQIFGPDDVYQGFVTLLAGISDLSIDVPEAPKLIGKFMARAIADRALHHSIIDSNHPKTSEKSKEAIQHAQVLLSINGGFELDNVWGIGGGLRPVKLLSDKINQLVEEYFSSSDKAEAERCLRSLAVPHFHHELVYCTIILAAERKERELNLALELLKYLQSSSLLTVEQLGSGFERAFSNAADISLDIPAFHDFLAKFVTKSLEFGIISKTLADEAPSRGRKRYLSQGDGGELKN